MYLEWAPSNVLSQSPTSKSNETNNAAVGENDAKRVMLEQSVEGISEIDIDPDRIEVKHICSLLCVCFVPLFYFCLAFVQLCCVLDVALIIVTWLLIFGRGLENNGGIGENKRVGGRGRVNQKNCS